MKRIAGRRYLTPEEFADYGNYKVAPIDVEKIFSGGNAVPPRFTWATHQIDTFLQSSIIIYKALDVGTNDGMLAASIASRHLTVGDPGSPTIDVDGLEVHPSAYLASEEAAKKMRGKGYRMTIHKTLFEEYATTKLYDAIFAFEVLEHTKDPLFCVEKMYDLLEIGGYLFMTIPEESGRFGITDKNLFHLWTGTVQSLMSVIFYDERKWKICELFDSDGIVHVLAQKRTYQR